MHASKFIRFTWLGVAVLSLGGCAWPQNPEEFKHSVVSTDEVVSTYSFNEAAAIMKKMAPRCLDVKIKFEYGNCANCRPRIRHFKPVITSGRQNLQLSLLSEWRLEDEKEYGPAHYFAVVDLTPANGKSKAVIYYPIAKYGAVADSIKGWMTGENVGCPDLASLPTN